jgi:hypothetical protein
MLDVYGEDPVSSIVQQLDAGDYKNATETAREIAGMALDGLAYYDTYEQVKLRTIVSLGYSFFGIYTLLYVRHVFGINKSAHTLHRKTTPVDILVVGAGAMVVVGAVIEKSPWHAIYAVFPIYLGRAILVNLWEGSSGIRIRTHNIAHAVKWLAQLALYSGALVAMAVSDMLMSVLSNRTLISTDKLIDGLQTPNRLVSRILASGHTSGTTRRAQSSQLLPEEFPLLQRCCMGSLAGREG